MDHQQLDINRRRFIAGFFTLGLGSTLMPGALAALAQDAETITLDLIEAAQAIAGLSFSRDEQERILSILNGPRSHLAALDALRDMDVPEREQVLADFAERWADEPLVMDQWFAVQASVPGPDTVARAEGLLAHPAFEWTLPNRVRAVGGSGGGVLSLVFARCDGRRCSDLMDLSCPHRHHPKRGASTRHIVLLTDNFMP